MIRESFRSVTCILLPLYARHVSGLPPMIFHFNQESARCGSSLFTANLALEAAEHSHAHDRPSRYVLDLVAHHGYIPEQHEGGEKHTGKQSPPKQYLYALRHETF